MERKELDFFGDGIDFLGGGIPAPAEPKGRVVTFVADYSLSAKSFLPAAALTCFDIMNQCLLRDGKQSWFGLLTYGNGAPKAPVYTDQPSRILEQMLGEKVGGGSGNGVEDTAAALRLACESMQQITIDSAGKKKTMEIPPENRILFLFTDSPTEESVNLRRIHWTGKQFISCPPIRAAVLFVPARTRAFQVHAARYSFPMVNAAGEEDRHRAPYIFSLESAAEQRILKDAENSEAWISQLLAAIR